MIATTTYAPSGLWRKVEFLTRLVPLATRLSLAAGEKRAEMLELKSNGRTSEPHREEHRYR
jgi:hypothetical protein